MRNKIVLTTIICFFYIISSGQNYSYQKPVGTWYLSEFIDSTVINKNVYKYASSLTYWVYMLTITNDKPDSCFIKSTHFGDVPLSLKCIDNYHYQTEGDYLKFDLQIDSIRGMQILKLKQIHDSTEYAADNSVYIFYKRLEDIKDIQAYFAENIFSGKYVDSKKGLTVTFNSNSTISGLDSINYYKIGLGNCDHEPEMDFISLNKEKQSHYLLGDRFYNWSYIGDHLILRKIKIKKSKVRWFDCKIGKVMYDFKKTK